MMKEVPLRLRRIAWIAAWRVIDMLKPTDKVSFGLMRSCRDTTLVNAEQALLRTGGRAAQISAKTAWGYFRLA